MARRYDKQVDRGQSVALSVDGVEVTACEGETIASLLLLLNKTACYRTGNNRPRMMFCNMGTCFECRVQVKHEGLPRWVLACTTAVRPGMQIETNVQLTSAAPVDPENV